MAQYTINLNERTAFGRNFLAFLQSMPQITITKINKSKSTEERKPNAATLKAMQEEKNGEVVRYENMDDFKKRMYAL